MDRLIDAESLSPPTAPKDTASAIVAPAFFVVGGFTNGTDDGSFRGLDGGQAVGTGAHGVIGLVPAGRGKV